ncbi:uncharacterized protein LOC107633961 [Arachis ipaensis]|uniref:uncharacterized protein LOC107633961 n=1 Tax=Arachis ipaensis TaxID=130454 RepID=UPI0007AF38B5|nr:uncharacterized protein LOC107633961 [Arachis ipaensis]XP_025640869.1 uncharacterized protein LOC112735553 [Arachis hypogaea]
MDPTQNSEQFRMNQGNSFQGLDPLGIATFLNHISSIQAHLNRNGSNPSQDSSSHFYLHPSENTSIPLIHTILDGKNYSSWSNAMLLALKSKNKLKFVDGSLKKPDKNDPLFELWDRCNTYVLAWIKILLNPEITQSVMWNKVAYELWEELYGTRQGEMSVTQYFTKLKSLWEEFDDFRPIPPCNCESVCTCGLGEMRKYRMEDHVTRFLRGLNEQFANGRAQVMLMEPLPDLKAVFSMMTRQERQNQSMDDTIDPKILLHSTNSFNTAETSQGRGRGKGRGGRFQGSIDKHGLGVVNFSAEINGDGIDDSGCEEKNGTSNVEFTPEQKSTLLALLNRGEAKQIHSANQITTLEQVPHQGNLVHIMHFKSSVLALNISASKHGSRIIDTGANVHVSYCLEDFQTHFKIAPIIIRLLNGAQIISNIAGTIKFLNKLYLTNALYIPSFNFKLISVSKDTKHLHCKMSFTDDDCEIQDLLSKKMIGAARVCGGLYTLNCDAA